MNKLIMLLTTILIGLNLSSCDPEETFHEHGYTQAIKNDSDQEIKWVFRGFATKLEERVLQINTMIIAPHTKSLGFSQGHFYSPLDDGQEESDFIENTISVYDSFPLNNEECKFQLYVGDQFIKEWNLPTGSFGDTINSPYNYDSWEVIKYDEVVQEGLQFIHGEIVFTISNEDIETN